VLIYPSLLISFGAYFCLNKNMILRLVGYTLIGHGSNLYLLTCAPGISPLMQSLVLTSIVIGIGIVFVVLRGNRE